MKKTLQAAAMAAKWWEPPRDALDTMTLGAADLESLKPYKHLDFMPFDPQVKRTEATIEGPEGKFKVTKGATHIILNLCVNKDEIHDEVDAKVRRLILFRLFVFFFFSFLSFFSSQLFLFFFHSLSPPPLFLSLSPLLPRSPSTASAASAAWLSPAPTRRPSSPPRTSGGLSAF